MSDMTDQSESERFAIRFRAGTLAELRRIADEETEGNVSFLVRRIIENDLKAREAAASSPRP